MSAVQLRYNEPMAEIIDGRAVARKLDAETKAQVDAMVAAAENARKMAGMRGATPGM